ncbi:MAG: esterase family protein [Chloroflexi bacterium]|nr:esterase family protein [Chloroflexota bacterium]
MHSVIAILLLLGIFSLTACSTPLATDIPAPTRTETQAAPTRTVRISTATAFIPTATALPPSPTVSPPTVTLAPTRTPTRKATRATIPDGLPDTLAAWEETVAEIAASADAQARVNALWEKLVRTRNVPFIVNDRVIFLYRGEATSVHWHGDFSFWAQGKPIQGQRAPNTDLWYGVANFPRDSRTDYQIVLNETQEILDPANPQRRNDGLDFNNVLTMPDFQITDETRRRPGIATGTLTDWIALESQAMEHPVNYRVYSPAGYAKLEKLPVLYVTDGNNFFDDRIGAMNAVLDNLIADGRIAPVLAVYIDAREPNPPHTNRRVNDFLVTPEKFAQFITQELIPTIDAQYRSDASRDARVLVGASFGGVFGTYAALRYPDVFGKLAAFSPAYWVLDNPNGAGSNAASGGQRMNDFIARAYNCGKSDVPCPASPQKIFFSTGIPGWDVGDLNPRAEPLRARGDTVQIFQIQEGHNWGAWSGLTDEMLEYFFAAH